MFAWQGPGSDSHSIGQSITPMFLSTDHAKIPEDDVEWLKARLWLEWCHAACEKAV